MSVPWSLGSGEFSVVAYKNMDLGVYTNQGPEHRPQFYVFLLLYSFLRASPSALASPFEVGLENCKGQGLGPVLSRAMGLTQPTTKEAQRCYIDRGISFKAQGYYPNNGDSNGQENCK